MRDYADGLLGRPKRGDIKAGDRPDGESGPTVSCAELRRYLENAKTPETRQDDPLREILKMLEKKDAALQKYEDKWEPGRYYIGSLLPPVTQNIGN